MKKALKITIIIIFSLIIAYLLLPRYVLRAVWHLGPSIDDHSIFHNRLIAAGDHEPWPVHENYADNLKWDSISNIIESYRPIAMLVIQNDSILYEEYWEGYNENSISNSFSAGKAIVSLLVGIALDEGKIKNLDQPVSDFIPEFGKGSRKVLTVRHLLTMSSGLNWQETYSTPFSPTAEAYYGSDVSDLVINLEVVEEPGKEFEYLSGNTQVLAMVVEAATGQRISDYASDKIWKHIGAKNNALWNLDSEDGMEKAYCCFNSNVRDFARFGKLILQKGMWNGKRIVSEKYIDEAISPKNYLIDKETGKPVDFYGFQWWIINYKGMEIPYMRGILGQYIFSIPDKNAIVVRLGHKRSKEYIGSHPKDVYDYLDAAFLLLK